MSTAAVLASHPLVVLGVPAYNEERYIQECLESIQGQTHRDFLVLIGDNGSTDGTGDICRRFSGQDKRFVHLRNEANVGAARNFECLLHSSDSQFFAWVGGHDRLHPEYLERHLAALQADPALGNSFSYFEFIDPAGSLIGRNWAVGTDAPQDHQMVRYLWSVAMGCDLGPIHGLFRRAAINGLAIPACPAADHVFLSSALYRAPWRASSAYLYQLRNWNDPARDRKLMARITGQAESTVDCSLTVAAYLAEFDRLIPTNSSQRRVRPLLAWLLRDRFLRRHFKATKLLRTITKRTWQLRSLLRRRTEPASAIG